MTDESPAPERDADPGQPVPGKLPIISVIIPYLDPRRRVEYLASWTRQQVLAAERFEVIVIAHRADRGLRAVQAQLRAHDRLLLSDADADATMLVEGAAVARGELLMISEDHCLADPGCLAAIERHFRDTSDAGATIQWGHINHTAVARMEARMSERDAQAMVEGSHWNRLRTRGFAIRRSVYEALGGFESEFGKFAEALLAAKMHANGHRIGYIAERGVRHINTYGFFELWHNITSYTDGECRYFVHGDPSFCDRYFGASGILSEAANQSKGDKRTALRFAIKATKQAGDSGNDDLPGLLREYHQSADTGRLGRLRPRLAMYAAQVRFYLASFDQDRQLQALKDYWRAVVRVTRARYYARNPNHAGIAIRLSHRPCTVVPADLLPSPNLVEPYAGRPFRWLAPVTTLRFQLPPGNYVVLIDTPPARGELTDLPAWFLWNGQPLVDGQLRLLRGMISLSLNVEHSGGQRQQCLTIVVPAYRGLAASDTRQLGLPACSLHIVDLAGALDATDRPFPSTEWHARALAIVAREPNEIEAPPPPVESPAVVLSVLSKATTPDPLRLLSVNTADQGGGAERIAWSLFDGFERRGHESWLAVGAKATLDKRVLPLFASPHVDYRREATWGRRLKQVIERRISRWTGSEDFSHPYSWLLPRLVGDVPDAILCHNLHGGYFDLRALPSVSREIPTFVVLHDLWLMTGHKASSCESGSEESGCGQYADSTLPPPATRGATRRDWLNKGRILADCRLYVSAPSQWLLDRAHSSLLKPSIVEARVIPNGIDLQTFRPGCRAEARCELPLSPHGQLAVFAGNNPVANPLKDFATVRAAFVRLAEEQPQTPLHLAVVGKAGEPERVGSLTIHHFPFVSQQLLARFYLAADVYVHAANVEPFGLVLAEALACGTPVVATKVGGIPEVVHSGQDGILVPPRDMPAFAAAVKSILRDTTLRQSMSEHAQRHARTAFDQTTMIDRYLTWIREVSIQATIPFERPACKRRAA